MLISDVPYRVTERRIDRRETFSCDEDPETYLRLLGENSDDAAARVLGWGYTFSIPGHGSGMRERQRSADNTTSPDSDQFLLFTNRADQADPFLQSPRGNGDSPSLGGTVSPSAGCREPVPHPTRFS